MMNKATIEKLKGKITVENIILATVFCEVMGLLASLGKTILNG